MNFLMFYIAAAIGGGGITFFTMKLMGYARWATGHSDGWEEEQFQKRKKRALKIKNWANQKMDSVPELCQRMDYHILVQYEELLNIWDTADRIAADL